MAAQPEPEYEDRRVYEGADSIRRLAQMGLRPDYFSTAVLRGHEMQARCVPVHPRTYRGQVMWAETLGELRTQLLDINQGWNIGRTGNYETAFHAPKGIALAVVGGDANTGVQGFGAPKAARRRGPLTAKRIRRNVLGQATFDLPEFADPPEDETCETWFFLLNSRQETMYSELSFPVSIGEDEKIGRWAERILFPNVPLVGAVTPVESLEDTDEPPSVHVGRK